MTRETLHTLTKQEAIRYFRADAVRIVNKIEVIFNTAEYWNKNTRKPEEQPINPDPGGKMATLKEHLVNYIAQLDKQAEEEAATIAELERIVRGK